MLILAIDPGETCGVVLYAADAKRVDGAELWPLSDLLVLIRMCHFKADALAIEDIEPYGMMSGMRDTLNTKEGIGRIIEALDNDELVRRVTRKAVKRHLLGRVTGSDAEVRAELVHRLGDVGTKKAPGPLYGVKSHCWAALAVAVTCAETMLAEATT